MKLDGRHMTAALALLAGSIVYNVWTFSKPRGKAIVPVHAMSVPAELPPGGGMPAAGVDARETPRAHDVALDREPRWARNPFMARVPEPEPAAPAVGPPPAPAEAEPVVNAVLYSAQRKLAMVDGRLVRVGDRVGGWTIAEILPNVVVMASPSGGTRAIARRMPAIDGRHRD